MQKPYLHQKILMGVAGLIIVGDLLFDIPEPLVLFSWGFAAGAIVFSEF